VHQALTEDCNAKENGCNDDASGEIVRASAMAPAIALMPAVSCVVTAVQASGRDQTGSEIRIVRWERFLDDLALTRKSYRRSCQVVSSDASDC